MMSGVLQLFDEHGIPLQLRRIAPCQYEIDGAGRPARSVIKVRVVKFISYPFMKEWMNAPGEGWMDVVRERVEEVGSEEQSCIPFPSVGGAPSVKEERRIHEPTELRSWLCRCM